ncbi:ferritin-like domain-containing protein [Woodsholea maritima]|uniref:ferritin-like domain-containing protein n=1 Tax=Woodsholea maritima TaxID=240237 RepID=UPI00036C59AC|nr:ferritin-like domain-containing protein [Woodsholea maritima]
MTRSLSILDAACLVLTAGEPQDKAERAFAVAKAWRAGDYRLPDRGEASHPPATPARPAQPELVVPGLVPRRRLTSAKGRFALMHAVAHIEFNAIDLAFDMVARFGADPRLSEDERRDFISDWITVGEDEARHFQMIRKRLTELGGDYGDLPAHNGLWDAAMDTSDDLAARLAIAPMVLEARGLDVTPGMIEKLKSVEDFESVAVLEVIYEEEVAHVGAGARWFKVLSAYEGQDPEPYFQTIVRERFKGGLKLPFNIQARLKAGMKPSLYQPLAVKS